MGYVKTQRLGKSGGITREQVQNVIETTIATVTIVRDIAAVEPVQGALGALCGMLKLLQMFLENGDDLTEIAQRCQRVAVVVKRAAESNKLRTDDHLLSAIVELQRFVENVCEHIKRRQERSTFRKLLSVHGDAKQIEGLKETLRDFLQDFQVHLELTQRMDVIEILELVKMQPSQPAAGTHPGLSPSYYTPPRPAIFFGREDMVTEIVETVQRGQHVVLIGTGGMGKSSIAKAVLNENSLASAFKAKLFITFDGVAPSTMTYQLFLDRVAGALNLPSANSTTILQRLTSLPALLVIDNAETFLDAGDVDSGQISETLAAIGALKTVCLIVTTRNHASVSANLPCKRLSIGGLTMKAACQAFSAVYTVAPVNKAIMAIFAALDHHPLSINILANAAAMNEWSPEEIIEAWDERQAGVLENANDKYRSLRVTVEISITSFQSSDRDSVALQILRAIAFLPQGIHRDDVHSIFPFVPNISSQLDRVRRSSLIYRCGERFTMLGPIRMYIADQYNAGLTYDDQLLSGVRAYFHNNLFHKVHAFIEREHGNIDRLMHFDMTSARYNNYLRTHLLVLAKADDFLHCTSAQPTSLWALLESEAQMWKVSDDEDTRKLAKLISRCLTSICWTYYVGGRLDDCLTRLQIAEAYCRACSPVGDESLVECLRLKAVVFERFRDLTYATGALREALSVTEVLGRPLIIARLHDFLAELLLLQGEVAEAKVLLASSQQAYEARETKRSQVIFALICQANIAIFESRLYDARLCLEQAADLNRRHHGERYRIRVILWQASCEGSAGDLTAALKLLQKATEGEVAVGTREFRAYVNALQGRAYYEARLGHLDDARRSIGDALKICSEYGERSWSGNFVRACIENMAGERQKAIAIVEGMLSGADQSKGDLATTHQALGELLHEGHRDDEARAQFEQAKAICENTGVSPTHMSIKAYHWVHSVTVKNAGWERFLGTYQIECKSLPEQQTVN